MSGLAPRSLREIPLHNQVRNRDSAKKSTITFSHGVRPRGEKDTQYSYWIKSGSPEKFRISEMKKLLDICFDSRSPEISLLTTACYSGGWGHVATS